jgi:DNA-binding response OmpR family regulator
MHITIVDDEKILTNKIEKKLINNGYSVDAFFSYHEFLQGGWNLSDLYIIDISLLDGSGFDIIKYLREKGCDAPIIIISWYGDSEKIIYGLNIWADDYLTKPFIPEELLARIQALLRRPRETNKKTMLTHKEITLDLTEWTVSVNEREVHLTKKEYLLLELFLQNIDKIVTRTELIERVWGSGKDLEVSDNTINVTLWKVRKKIGASFALEALYNQGYILH